MTYYVPPVWKSEGDTSPTSPTKLRPWLLPTSLAQRSHSYGMDSEIPELQCYLNAVFCIGHNFETIISGEMLGIPTQCHSFVIYDDTGQKTHLN